MVKLRSPRSKEILTRSLLTYSGISGGLAREAIKTTRKMTVVVSSSPPSFALATARKEQRGSKFIHEEAHSSLHSTSVRFLSGFVVFGNESLLTRAPSRAEREMSVTRSCLAKRAWQRSRCEMSNEEGKRGRKGREIEIIVNDRLRLVKRVDFTRRLERRLLIFLKINKCKTVKKLYMYIFFFIIDVEIF